MRPLSLRWFLALLIPSIPVQAQTLLFEEAFDSCAFPSTWQALVTGPGTPLWYVGLSQNSQVPNQSLDGSCFLFIDDRTPGAYAPAYSVDFVSPPFHTTGYTTVWLEMDLHYYSTAGDTLSILVTDGVQEIELARYDNYRSMGPSLSGHVAFSYDLALLPVSPALRLIIRYDDSTADHGGWAGVDNIRVTGSGTGENVLAEAFNRCAKPAGWEAEIVQGPKNWTFGRIPRNLPVFSGGSTMDGSCFVYFHDTELGEQAPYSTVRLYSPWFSGTDYFNYTLNTDLIFRKSKAQFSIYLEDSTGTETPIFQPTESVGGPNFPDYEHLTFDLSPHRSAQWRLIFEYWDGNEQDYWVGIDNVKVTGIAPSQDDCQRARPLFTGANGALTLNETAFFDGPPVACVPRGVGSMWYYWDADFSGVARVRTRAGFNDVAEVFSGNCAGLQALTCNDRDEHGFTGEDIYFTAQAGTRYYVRISGVDSAGFGVSRGALRPVLEQMADYPAKPANDNCSGAVVLTLDAPCLTGTNNHADMSPALPALNRLARADVWYTFTPGSGPAPGTQWEIRSNAAFSDIMTLYQGGCASLTEIAANRHGGTLELPALAAGQPYYLQIAGTFATVEGGLCPEWHSKPAIAPANDHCLDAIEIPLNGPCVAGNNQAATFSGYQPPCAVTADRDIWFKFVAPAYGSVHINTGAGFEHTLAIWAGDCDSLNKVFCIRNPLRCSGFVTVGSLTAGQTYYLQIASWGGPAGTGSGAVCVQVLDGALPSGLSPLQVSVARACVGCDSVRLDITASGGTPPYTFKGNTPGQIIPRDSFFVAVVEDAAGCAEAQSEVASDCTPPPCEFSIRITVDDITCSADSNGLLIAETNGGPSPFQFKWSNGADTESNSGLTSGTYIVTVTSSDCCSSTASATLGAGLPEGGVAEVQVAARVFLQGPYVSATQLMYDSLRVRGVIPLAEPYTGLSGFSHKGGGGEQTTPAVLAVSGPDAIVDWVFLELRNASNPAQVLATRAALLQRDGDVVDVDGVSPVRFFTAASHTFWLAVRHRNHLGVQLGASRYFPKCTVIGADFATVPPEGFFAYNGLNAAQKLVGGVYLLWAANGRTDYQLKYNGSNNDRTAILSVVGLATPNALVPGYFQADYNLDGVVKYNGAANDRNVLLGNVGIATPSAIIHDQVAR